MSVEPTPLELAQRLACALDGLDLVSSLSVKVVGTDCYLIGKVGRGVVSVAEERGGEYGRALTVETVEAGPIERYTGQRAA